MRSLLRFGQPRPYEYRHRGAPPSFDRFPGTGVLLFSALDTADELRIATHLEAWRIPVALVPMPLCPEALRLEVGAAARLTLYGEEVPLDRVGAVWSLTGMERPLPSGRSPAEHQFELSEWRAALAMLAGRIRGAWVNDPARGDLSRLGVLELAGRLGFRVPRTLVTNRSEAAARFLEEVGGRCVAKRVGHEFPTMPDGSTLPAFTRRVSLADLTAGGLGSCPALLQEEVETVSERRVYVIGKEVVAFELTAPGGVDWREHGPAGCRIESVSLGASTEERVRALVDLLGLRYAAVDLLDDGRGALTFLEVNPHGAHGFCSDLVDPSLSERIARYLRSCL